MCVVNFNLLDIGMPPTGLTLERDLVKWWR